MNEEIKNGAAPALEDENEIIAVRRRKLAEAQAEGRDPFAVTKYDVTAHAGEIKDNFEQFDQKEVSLAGRLMSRRDMGKANFIDIADVSGRIQAYVRVDDIGEECFNEYRKWDIGDIIGLEGFVFKTRRGEISIHAKKLIKHCRKSYHITPLCNLL